MKFTHYEKGFRIFCRKNQVFANLCPRRVWILQGIPQQQKDTLICRLVSFTFQKKNGTFGENGRPIAGWSSEKMPQDP